MVGSVAFLETGDVKVQRSSELLYKLRLVCLCWFLVDIVHVVFLVDFLEVVCSAGFGSSFGFNHRIDVQLSVSL